MHEGCAIVEESHARPNVLNKHAHRSTIRKAKWCLDERYVTSIIQGMARQPEQRWKLL